MEPLTSTQVVLARAGAICAPTGAFILVVSTLLHPLDADPNDASAAFAEYAADPLWVWSHLGQFLGVAVLGMSLIGFAGTFESGRAAAWGRFARAGTAAVIAVAAALQAVDGVALKAMVDRWAAAGGEEREALFAAAFAVRQIETGLAGLLNVVFGFTSAMFGIAILSGARYPAWLGGGALLVALAMFAGGGATAASGFSDVAMTMVMVATVLFLVWIICAGILMVRLTTS